jgi:hypothetical protein
MLENLCSEASEKKNEIDEIIEHQIYSRTISFSKIFKWLIFVFQIASLFIVFFLSLLLFCSLILRPTNSLQLFGVFLRLRWQFSSVQLSFFFSGEIFLETGAQITRSEGISRLLMWFVRSI